MYLLDCINTYLFDVKSYAEARTVEYYHDNLMRFYDFCFLSFHTVDIDVEMLSSDLFRSYILYLRKSNIKHVSINTYTRAVRVFSNWLLNNDYLDYSFCNNVKKLRSDAAAIIPLTQKDYNLIICKIWGRSNALRNECIFSLMLECGLRLQEVLNLKISDLHDTYISINSSKYNKNRFVPLPARLHLTIRKYICDRKSGFVFLTKSNEQLTKSAVTKLFVNIKKDTNILYVHPHQLRHTFATSYVAGGGNLEFLRILLGHSDYGVTKNYLHVAQEVLISGIDIYKLDSCFFKNYNNN